jgi:hypothetical protein
MHVDTDQARLFETQVCSSNWNIIFETLFEVFCQDHSIAGMDECIFLLQCASIRENLEGRQLQLGVCCLHWGLR